MKKSVKSYLQDFGFAHLLPESVVRQMNIIHLRKGDVLFSQGDDAHYLYLFVEGKLRISMLSPEGKRLVLTFKQPFDFVGDIEYIQHSPYINTVETVMDSVLLEIPYAILRSEMADHPGWLQLLLETITRKFVLKSRAMNFNLLYETDVRIASYLLSMTPESAVIDSTSLIDMADFIGTSYRHLHRVLQTFEEEGLLQKKRGTITVLNRAELEARAGENIYEQEDGI